MLFSKLLQLLVAILLVWDSMSSLFGKSPFLLGTSISSAVSAGSSKKRNGNGNGGGSRSATRGFDEDGDLPRGKFDL